LLDEKTIEYLIDHDTAEKDPRLTWNKHIGVRLTNAVAKYSSELAGVEANFQIAWLEV
jgi:hypothetical protein